MRLWEVPSWSPNVDKKKKGKKKGKKKKKRKEKKNICLSKKTFRVFVSIICRLVGLLFSLPLKDIFPFFLNTCS